jgi:hypothetical protein
MSKTILAVLVALVLSSGIAHADAADAYLAELQRRGVDYSTPSAATRWARRRAMRCKRATV